MAYFKKFRKAGDNTVYIVRDVEAIAALTALFDGTQADTIQGQAEEFRSNLDTLLPKISENTTAINQNAANISDLQTTTDSLQADIDSKSSSIEELIQTTSGLSGTVEQNTNDISSLDGRLTDDETLIAQNGSQIEFHQTEIDSIKSINDEQSEQIESIQTAISSIESDVANTTDSINSLTESVGSLSSTLSDLDERVETIENRPIIKLKGNLPIQSGETIEEALANIESPEVGDLYLTPEEDDNTQMAEYLYTVNSTWERLGTINAGTIDLSEYYTANETDELIATAVTHGVLLITPSNVKPNGNLIGKVKVYNGVFKKCVELEATTNVTDLSTLLEYLRSYGNNIGDTSGTFASNLCYGIIGNDNKLYLVNSSSSDTTIYVIDDEFDDIPASINITNATLATDEDVANAFGEMPTYEWEDLIKIDDAPTENSSNLISSGGVYDALQNGGGSVDLSNYPTKTELNEALINKQDIIVYTILPNANETQINKLIFYSNRFYTCEYAGSDVTVNTISTLKTYLQQYGTKVSVLQYPYVDPNMRLVYQGYALISNYNLKLYYLVQGQICEVSNEYDTIPTIIDPEFLQEKISYEITDEDVATVFGTCGVYEWKEVEFTAIQKWELPTATAQNEGVIYQFVGSKSDPDYTFGYFYESVYDEDNQTYKWQQLNVQPNASSGSSTVNVKYYAVDEIIDQYSIGGEDTTSPVFIDDDGNEWEYEYDDSNSDGYQLWYMNGERTENDTPPTVPLRLKENGEQDIETALRDTNKSLLNKVDSSTYETDKSQINENIATNSTAIENLPCSRAKTISFSKSAGSTTYDVNYSKPTSSSDLPLYVVVAVNANTYVKKLIYSDFDSSYTDITWQVNDDLTIVFSHNYSTITSITATSVSSISASVTFIMEQYSSNAIGQAVLNAIEGSNESSVASSVASTVAELEAIEAGQIVQYIGTTTSKYTKGYFYTKNQLSATLNVTAGSGYYSTNIGTSELESTLPYSLYGGWTLNSVSDVNTALSVISNTDKVMSCSNTSITISDSGSGTIALSYPITDGAPSDPFTVTMSVTAIVAVPTMNIDVDSPTASEVSYDDSSSELGASDVQEAIDSLNSKINDIDIPTATVDQTYDATSTNAQSGTAVAQALATVSRKTFELLTPPNSDYNTYGYLLNLEDSEGNLSGTISDWSSAKGVMITVDNYNNEKADDTYPHSMMSVTYDTTAPNTSASNITDKKRTFIAMKSPTSEMLKVSITAGTYGERSVSRYFTISIDTKGDYTISCPYAPKEDSDSESDFGWGVYKIRSIYVIY